MHTIGFNGKKLLEAICFEDIKFPMDISTISLGKANVKTLVNSQVILNSLVEDIKEKDDQIVSLKGYDLGRALVGEKNALYIAAVQEQDASKQDASNNFMNLYATGSLYSLNKFKEAAKNYDRCVSCGAITPYKKTTHIDEREGYVEGAGQLCNSCDKEIYEKGK